MRLNKALLLVVCLTFFAFVLRIYHLDTNCIWLDEMFSFQFSQHGYLDIWNLIVGGENNPPLFYWILHTVFSFFGADAFTLRICSAIIGALTIPVFYLIGKEFYDHEGGIIMALLGVFSTFHIWFSQEGRAYALAVFITSLAFWYYLKKDHTKTGLLCGLAFWVHFYSMVFTAMLFLHGLIRSIHLRAWSSIPKVGKGCLAYLIVAAPVIAITISLYLKRVTVPISYGYTGFDTVLPAFIQFFGMNEVTFAFFMYLFLFGLSYLIFNHRDKLALIAIVILGMFSISYFLSFKFDMIPRYLIYLLPLFLLIFTAPYYTLKKYTKYAFPIFTTAIILISIFSLALFYATPSKDNWKDFSSNLTEYTDDGDSILLAPEVMKPVFEYYYNVSSDKTSLSTKNMDFWYKPHTAISNYTYIVVYGWEPSINSSFKQWADTNLDLVEQQQSIYLYKVKNKLDGGILGISPRYAG